MHFNIEGQPQIMSTKGFLVQAPYRNIYSMEVICDAPELFLEVTVTGSWSPIIRIRTGKSDCS